MTTNAEYCLEHADEVNRQLRASIDELEGQVKVLQTLLSMQRQGHADTILHVVAHDTLEGTSILPNMSQNIRDYILQQIEFTGKLDDLR